MKKLRLNTLLVTAFFLSLLGCAGESSRQASTSPIFGGPSYNLEIITDWRYPATVYVDGVAIGTVPAQDSARFWVTPGSHAIQYSLGATLTPSTYAGTYVFYSSGPAVLISAW